MENYFLKRDGFRLQLMEKMTNQKQLTLSSLEAQFGSYKLY
jgi:hypothetical protein